MAAALVSAAFMTLAIILLHMFWGVVFFEACEKQRWLSLAVVVTSHLLVSCLVSKHLNTSLTLLSLLALIL